mmetsp:Transcript_31810/g.68498  ORF Transcript_31810/g.68498 Transcript_31810/m.68498 type:complete len:206 (-) Transcript_31810:1578-2195(-)
MARLDQSIFIEDQGPELLVELLLIVDLRQDQFCIRRIGRTHRLHLQVLQPSFVLLQICFGVNTHPLGHAHQLCAVNLGHAPSAGKKVEIRVHRNELPEAMIFGGQTTHHIVKFVHFTSHALPIPQGCCVTPILRVRARARLGDGLGHRVHPRGRAANAGVLIHCEATNPVLGVQLLLPIELRSERRQLALSQALVPQDLLIAGLI